MIPLVIVFLTVLLPPLPGRAQEDLYSPVFSLEDCIARGREYNPAIRKAKQEMEAARGKKLQALSDVIPVLSGEAGYTYLDDIDYLDTDGESIPIDAHDNYQVTVKAEQNLYKGGQMLAGIKAALLYGRYSEAGYREAEVQADYTIKELFYQLLLAREIVKVRRDTVAHMNNYLDTARRKNEEGSASEFELITAEVRLANAAPPLIQAQNRVEMLNSSLAKEIGMKDLNFGVEGDLSYREFDAGLDELNRVGLELRPGLEQARLSLDLLDQNVTVALSGYHPQLSAFVSYEGVQPQFGYPPEERFEFEWTAGALVRWNFFDGLLTPGKVKEARAQREQARITAEDTRRTVLLEIKQASLDLKSARQTIESQRKVVGQAEKAYGIAKIRWENGLSTYLELTDAELALSEARVTLVEALAQYRIALAKIEKAVGISLPEIEQKLAANQK